MENTLKTAPVVIGISHRTAPVEVRERFWISDTGRFETLQRLVRADGIEEAVILSTCNRTEFILWGSDLAAAGVSLRALLTEAFGLQAADWENFYRHAGDAALHHIFSVTAGLDSMVLGEPEITGQVKTAWTKAQQAGATGRFLDAVFQKALNVAKRVRTETAIGNSAVSVPYAAVELARRIFGSLQGRVVLILGAGKMSELSARYLLANGAAALHVTNRTHRNAVELAKTLGGTAVAYEDRWGSFAAADIVITSTGCPHTIVHREDAERIRRERQGRPFFLIDIAVPRDVDPAVREVPGVFLYDIDDLERVVAQNLAERRAAAAEAEKIIAREAPALAARLDAERVVPTLVALRERLEEIRAQELEHYRSESGPLSAAEEKALEALTARIIQRIANRLAGELKHVPDRPERDQLTEALRRLFQLQAPFSAPARPDPRVTLSSG